MTQPASLTTDQIKYFASQQGFTGSDLNTAVAVALAESGGNPASHTVDSDDDSYGLWQINMKGSLGPSRMKQFGLKSPNELLDPNVNAKAARIIFNEHGWKAWGAYTNQSYKKFVAQATAAKPVNNANRTPADEAAAMAASRNDATPDGLDIGSSLNAIGDTLFKGAAGLTGVIIGIALIVLAVVILLRNQIPAMKILKGLKGATK